MQVNSTNEWKIDSTPRTILKRLSVSNLKPVPFKLKSSPKTTDLQSYQKVNQEITDDILVENPPGALESQSDSDHTFDESSSEVEDFPVSPDISICFNKSPVKGPVMMSTPQILRNTLQQVRNQISPSTPSKLGNNSISIVDVELNNRTSKMDGTDLTMQEKVYISLLELLMEQKQTRQETLDTEMTEWYQISKIVMKSLKNSKSLNPITRNIKKNKKFIKKKLMMP